MMIGMVWDEGRRVDRGIERGKMRKMSGYGWLMVRGGDGMGGWELRGWGGWGWR